MRVRNENAKTKMTECSRIFSWSATTLQRGGVSRPPLRGADVVSPLLYNANAIATAEATSMTGAVVADAEAGVDVTVVVGVDDVAPRSDSEHVVVPLVLDGARWLPEKLE